MRNEAPPLILNAHGPHCDHCADAAAVRGARARRAGADRGAARARGYRSGERNAQHLPATLRRSRAAPTPPAAAPPASRRSRRHAGTRADLRASAGTDLRQSVCLMIESAARAHNLPLEFFARVIWQESRFQPNVVGPRTRSGDRAQGIAQFMPRTAAERGLLDPFDPVQALPKSAEFLRELADQFGNLGLAAAAYNAGPQRVRDWMAGARTLPAETRNYVYAITGISADEWAHSGKREPVQPVKPNCEQLMALLHRAPNPFVAKLEERVNLTAGAPWGVQLSRRLLARARARVLCRARQALRRDPHRPRPSLLSTVLRSRGTNRVLPGAGRRRDPRRPPRACAAASAAPAAPAWCCATARADAGRPSQLVLRQRLVPQRSLPLWGVRERSSMPRRHQGPSPPAPRVAPDFATCDPQPVGGGEHTGFAEKGC